MNKYESTGINIGYCEFITGIKTTLKIALYRILIILASLALITAMLVVTLKTIPTVSFMCMALIIFVTWFVLQFTKVEYQYEISTGILTLTRILGSRTKKKVLQLKTADICAITPFSDINSLDIPEKSIFYACDKDNNYAICLAYCTKDGEKKGLVIAAPSNTVSCLKHYKRAVFTDAMLEKKM